MCDIKINHANLTRERQRKNGRQNAWSGCSVLHSFFPFSCEFNFFFHLDFVFCLIFALNLSQTTQTFLSENLNLVEAKIRITMLVSRFTTETKKNIYKIKSIEHEARTMWRFRHTTTHRCFKNSQFSLLLLNDLDFVVCFENYM